MSGFPSRHNDLQQQKNSLYFTLQFQKLDFLCGPLCALLRVHPAFAEAATRRQVW